MSGDGVTSGDGASTDAVTAADDLRGTLAVFSVLWGLAAVWHVASAPVTASPPTQYLLAAGVAAVIAFPGAPAALVLVSAGVLATVWSEAPVLGNHWALAGFISIGLLACVASTAGPGRFGDRDLLARRVLPLLRTCWVAFYAFAAFAKLNSSFFDRAVSCGVVYFRESTESIGLAGLQMGGNAGVEWAVIVGTAAIELSIPVLLLLRRTRSWGVVVALAFHGLLALDRAHPFTDFSSLLAALFVCFLPASSLGAFARAVRGRIAEHDLVVRVVGALLPAGLVASVAARAIDPGLLDELRWWSWQGLSLAIVVGVGVHVARRRPVPEPAVLSVRPVALLLVPALVVLNGIAPYVEVKTSYGWNMYANLRTADGESNHLIVRRTLPLGDEQDDLVRILASDDPGLEAYVDRDFVLTRRSLRAYLARHPDAAITYEQGGRTTVLARASDEPDLVVAPPDWRQKVQPFRAVDGGEPERCQTSFLPAG